MDHRALYWHAESDGVCRCDLCPHRCRIADGGAGLCGARRAEGARLAAATYGLVSSAQMDPIEKKPLYHFHPGSEILSIGGWGCNLACAFCQNWTISQRTPEGGRRWTADDVAGQADRCGSAGIAYTYNEPLVAFEFVLDCSRRAREAGLANVLVTNGFCLEEPARELLPVTDALNVDIKCIDDEFYRRHCRGRVEPVLGFCRQAVEIGCHVEVTNLLIPGLNDSEDAIRRLAGWVREHLGRTVPLHFSGYRPQYRMTVEATPGRTLERAHELAREEGLLYVYVGNVLTRVGQDTSCPGCGAVLITRQGYSTRTVGLRGARCASCGRPADFVLPGVAGDRAV